ncbi:MAG: DUF5801 repeats-in-toxin domain-containing protein, partial [Sulfuricurvum sp.]|nr:DUF5801 repeats-in-toxin domain-containing protein [Sulfuricurvum sp.]
AVQLQYEVTRVDGDGDSVTQAGTVNLITNENSYFSFDDDGPTAGISLITGANIIMDETIGLVTGDDNAATDDISALNPDPFFGLYGTPIGALSNVDMVNTTTDAGADNEGATTAVTLSIVGGSGVDSGLMTTDGTNTYDISLYMETNGTVTGRTGGAEGTVVFAISINSDGEVTVAQYEPLKHTLGGSNYDDAVDLTNKLEAVVTVMDGDKDVASSSIDIGSQIHFEDDGLSIGTPQDVIMTNALGNSVEGVDLDITTGADVPVQIVLTPDTEASTGFAIDKGGNYLTSQGHNIVYFTDELGVVTAKQYLGLDASNNIIYGAVVFTLSPDLESGTYSGTYSGGIDGILDGGAHTISIDYSTSGVHGGNNTVLAYHASDSTPSTTGDDLYVVVTATGPRDPDTVNYDTATGMGVNQGTTINTNEALILNFTNQPVIQNGVLDSGAVITAQENPLSMTDATFVLSAFTESKGDVALWEAWSGGVKVASGEVDAQGSGSDKTEMFTVISEVDNSSIVLTSYTSVTHDGYVDTYITNNGAWIVDRSSGVISFDGSQESMVSISYTLDGSLTSADITLAHGQSVDLSAFDSVVFTSQVGDYSVLSMTGNISSEFSGTDHMINVNVDVYDSDGDKASSSFDVTFDADGNLIYTPDTVISGGSAVGEVDSLVLPVDTSIDFSSIDSHLINNIEVIDLNAGDHSLTNLSIADVINMTSPDLLGVHTLTIVGDILDSVNIPTGYAHSSIESGFDVYTYGAGTQSDPTVVLKVEHEINSDIIP